MLLKDVVTVSSISLPVLLGGVHPTSPFPFDVDGVLGLSLSNNVVLPSYVMQSFDPRDRTFALWIGESDGTMAMIFVDSVSEQLQGFCFLDRSKLSRPNRSRVRAFVFRFSSLYGLLCLWSLS